MANYATKYVKRVDDFLSSTHTKSEIDELYDILNKLEVKADDSMDHSV